MTLESFVTWIFIISLTLLFFTITLVSGADDKRYKDKHRSVLHNPKVIICILNVVIVIIDLTSLSSYAERTYPTSSSLKYSGQNFILFPETLPSSAPLCLDTDETQFSTTPTSIPNTRLCLHI